MSEDDAGRAYAERYREALELLGELRPYLAWEVEHRPKESHSRELLTTLDKLTEAALTDGDAGKAQGGDTNLTPGVQSFSFEQAAREALGEILAEVNEIAAALGVRDEEAAIDAAQRVVSERDTALARVREQNTSLAVQADRIQRLVTDLDNERILRLRAERERDGARLVIRVWREAAGVPDGEDAAPAIEQTRAALDAERAKVAKVERICADLGHVAGENAELRAKLAGAESGFEAIRTIAVDVVRYKTDRELLSVVLGKLTDIHTTVNRALAQLRAPAAAGESAPSSIHVRVLEGVLRVVDKAHEEIGHLRAMSEGSKSDG